MSAIPDETENEFAQAAGFDTTPDGEDDGSVLDAAPEQGAEPGQPALYRNEETGRFETAQQREQRLYANKYETPEALEAGYQNLEQKFGEQANELGQYRQWLAQQQQAQAQQAQTPQVSPSDFESLLDSDPEGAVRMAIDARNPHLYEQAIRSWADIDPIGAQRFEFTMAAQAQQAQMQQMLAPLQQAAYAQQASAAQHQAMSDITQRYPDFAQHEAQILQVAERAGPGFLSVLQSGDPGAISTALEMLYLAGKGLAGGAVPAQQAPPAQSRMGKGGQVASATSVPPTDQPGRTMTDAWHELFEAGLESMKG